MERMSVANTRKSGGARLPRQAAREERDRKTQRLEPAPEILRMLIGEQFGGRHQGNLAPQLHGLGRRQGRHQGLAAAHIALDQAQHGLSEGRISLLYFTQHPPLRRGQLKR